MSDITLSKAVRSNLLNLQSTAELLSKSQERLSTGLRVNSALDNPTNFFTAQGLNSRANDLSQLLDSVSNAVQTVSAADKGLTAITKLVESAQATARQALQTSETIGGTTAHASTSNTSGLTIGAGGASGPATIDGGPVPLTNTLLGDGFDDGDEITFQAGSGPVYHVVFVNTGPIVNDATHYTFDISSNETVEDLLDTLSFSFGPVAFSENGDTDFDTFSIDTSGADPIFSMGSNITDSLTIGGSFGSAMGFAGTAQPVAGTGGTAGDVVVNGQTISLTAGDGASQILTKFQNAATGSSGANAFTVGNSGGVLTLTGTNGNDLAISGDAATLAAVGLSATTINGVPGGTNPKRAELVDQYNDVLGQIDQLAKDSGFNGVNLLDGDNLSVLFNEDGTSKLDITGVTDSASSLGLDALVSTAFDTNVSIHSTLDDLKGAIDTLRTQSSKFGSNLSVVETRQDFTKNMINVLQTGASNLTIADTNEEAANVLALQTRQQLSSTALSLASQADQNVLRLF